MEIEDQEGAQSDATDEDVDPNNNIPQRRVIVPAIILRLLAQGDQILNEQDINTPLPLTKYQQIQQSINCRYCNLTYQSILREPYLLPCGHTFCQDCIGRRIKQQKRLTTKFTCPFVSCNALLGSLPLVRNDRILEIISQLAAKYIYYDEQIDLLHNSKMKDNTQDINQSCSKPKINQIEQPDYELSLSKGICTFAFEYRDKGNAHYKSGLILKDKHPELAIKHYRQRILLFNDDVPQNQINNRNASTGSDFFSIGKIQQNILHQEIEALESYGNAIASYFYCDQDTVWNEYSNYKPQHVIADLQEGVVVIDHVLEWLYSQAQAQALSKLQSLQILNLLQQKLAFFAKFEDITNKFNLNAKLKQEKTRKYIYDQAALCMQISNLYRDHLNSEDEAENNSESFKQRAHDLITETSGFEECNEREVVVKIEKILIRLEAIEAAYEKFNCASVIDSSTLFHEIKTYLRETINEANNQIQ